MQKPREKLEIWLNNNPQGYLDRTLADIAAEAGTSITSVQRYLYKLIAERDNVLPSDVKKQREAKGFITSPLALSDETVQEIYDYSKKGFGVEDIAFVLGINENTVRKYLSKR